MGDSVVKRLLFFRFFFGVLFLLFLFFNFSLSSVFAETLSNKPEIGCQIDINSFTGVPTIGCLAQVLVNVVQWAMGFSLLAGMGYFIFGAITFMMAQDEKGVKAGRDKMVWSVLGFVFIVISFLLIRVVLLLLGFPDIINDFSFFVKR